MSEWVRVSRSATVSLNGNCLSIYAFERAGIVERTLDGLAAARRGGKRLGRPLGERGPAPERVVALRAAGRSWTAIARRLGCTIGSARRALERGLPKSGRRQRLRRSVGRGIG